MPSFSKASASLTPHLGEMYIESSLASLSTPQPGEAPGSVCRSISVDQFRKPGPKFRPLDFTSSPAQWLQQLFVISEGCNKGKETADGEIAGADLGEEGGGQLGGCRCSTSLSRSAWHRVFLT